MQNKLAALTLILLILLVLSRAIMLRRKGIKALHFGELDKTDFLIPPVALLYFYTVFAAAFGWPLLSTQQFFSSAAAAWLGVIFCLLGLLIFAWSLVSFGRSFRVGIDADQPGTLVTSGAFALSRNPIYVAFWIILCGQFLVFSNWILLVFLAAATWLFHRQVLREEDFMKGFYGQAYAAYCQKVRRYI